MESQRPHKDLEVWKLSISFVKSLYSVTSEFPSEEKYGITSQLRRAGISISTNIAEGAARDSRTEFIRFLNISSGSLSEVDTFLILSGELGFLPEHTRKELTEDLEQISAMLSGLITHLESNSS